MSRQNRDQPLFITVYYVLLSYVVGTTNLACLRVVQILTIRHRTVKVTICQAVKIEQIGWIDTLSDIMDLHFGFDLSDLCQALDTSRPLDR